LEESQVVINQSFIFLAPAKSQGHVQRHWFMLTGEERSAAQQAAQNLVQGVAEL